MSSYHAQPYYPYYNQGTYGQQQNYQVNQPQYFATPSYSTTSDNDFQLNVPVASGWVNQGLNATTYNPYFQQQAYNVSPTSNYNLHGYAQYPQEQIEEKTYTHQSTKSQKMEQSRASSRSSQAMKQASQANLITEDLNQLTPQIEAAYEEATGKRRQPVIKRQVITMPGEAGRVQQVVRRLPTPTPDVIERVFIVKPQRDTINLVIERPSTPPVQYKDKTVYGKTRRPIINPKVVAVAPRTNYPHFEQQSMHYQPQEFQPIEDYSGYQQQQPQMQQDQMQIEAPKGYLISPVKYDENQLIQQAIQQTMDQQNEEQKSMAQSGSIHPTFSTNILQPYNPPMLDQYVPPQMGYGQYPQSYGTQLF